MDKKPLYVQDVQMMLCYALKHCLIEAKHYNLLSSIVIIFVFMFVVRI